MSLLTTDFLEGSTADPEVVQVYWFWLTALLIVLVLMAVVVAVIYIRRWRRKNWNTWNAKFTDPSLSAVAMDKPSSNEQVLLVYDMGCDAVKARAATLRQQLKAGGVAQVKKLSRGVYFYLLFLQMCFSSR